MNQQQKEFAAVFSDAFPHLNSEDKRLLIEMARLWPGRAQQRKPDVLVIHEAPNRQ